MENKFRHEHSNRQDKARKPDYLEALKAESQLKSTPEHLANFKQMLAHGMKRTENSKEIRNYNEQLTLRYYDGVFCLGERHFRFRWSLREYIVHNHLTKAFSAIYKQQKVAATQDFKAIEEAIRKSNATWGCRSKGDSSSKSYSLCA